MVVCRWWLANTPALRFPTTITHRPPSQQNSSQLLMMEVRILTRGGSEAETFEQQTDNANQAHQPQQTNGIEFLETLYWLASLVFALSRGGPQRAGRLLQQ